MVSLPQFWDWLENKRDKNDKVFRGVWKTVETEAGKIRVARREETEREKEIGRKKAEERRKEEKSKKYRIIEVKKVIEK